MCVCVCEEDIHTPHLISQPNLAEKPALRVNGRLHVKEIFLLCGHIVANSYSALQNTQLSTTQHLPCGLVLGGVQVYLGPAAMLDNTLAARLGATLAATTLSCPPPYISMLQEPHLHIHIYI